MRTMPSIMILLSLLALPQSASADFCSDYLRARLQLIREQRGPEEIRITRDARITSSLKKYASKTEAGTLFVKDAVTPQGRPMHYEFIRPQPGHPTVVLIHGLLDDLTKLDSEAAEAAARGDGVLRVDLHGFGESYKELMKQTDNRLPENMERSFDYKNNIHDISTLVDQLGIQNPYVMGHSLGGAMAWYTTLALEKLGHTVRSLTMLAPYVQRIDGYLEKSAITGRAATNKALDSSGKVMRAGGVNSDEADIAVRTSKERSLNREATLRPWVDSAYNTYTRTMDPFRDKLYLDRTMYSAYREHLVHRLGKTEETLTHAESEDIDRRVKIAIAVTKSARGIDLLNTSTYFDIPKAPMVLIWGGKDRLVPPDEIEEFYARLKRAGKSNVQGYVFEDGTHFFPYTEGSEIFSAVPH